MFLHIKKYFSMLSENLFQIAWFMLLTFCFRHLTMIKDLEAKNPTLIPTTKTRWKIIQISYISVIYELIFRNLLLDPIMRWIEKAQYQRPLVPKSGLKSFGKKLENLQIKSERDSAHSQNSMQLSEDFRLPSDLGGDIRTQAYTRSAASLSRPNLERKRPNATTVMTRHLLELYKKCFPPMQYNPAMKPQRILTEIPENCYGKF